MKTPSASTGPSEEGESLGRVPQGIACCRPLPAHQAQPGSEGDAGLWQHRVWHHHPPQEGEQQGPQEKV